MSLDEDDYGDNEVDYLVGLYKNKLPPKLPTLHSSQGISLVHRR